MRATTTSVVLLLLFGCDAAVAPSIDAPGDAPEAIDGGARDAASTDAGADTGALDAGLHHSAGCIDGAGLLEGESTFMLEGMSRRYIVRLPTGYTRDRAWPLVFALHGNGGSIDEWDRTTGSKNIRAVLADDAVLIVTEAIGGNWRDYDAPADTWPARMETELAYFDAIVDRAEAELCIDEDAIFAMGFSGGGSFSGVLACRRTDIRAIAVGGAVTYFEPAECVGTAAAWITIGDAETNAGRESYRDFWRDRAGCTATSSATTPEGCVAYEGCREETPVTFCAHPGGHVWPDFGSEAMGAFFRRFMR